MAGKFFNTSTTYTEMVNNANQTMKTLLDNPYYLFSDKKATSCTYYNINTTESTLDEATRGNYGEITNYSPLRFNKISNFLIYGATKIDVNLDIGDFGLETSDITGEAVILPRTIVPFPGDYFFLNYIEEDLAFMVTAVNPNTLDTGATMYRINYTLANADGKYKNIEDQVVRRFNFVLNNDGTNASANVVEESVFDNTVEMQDVLTDLKDDFASMFWDAKVQTFTYRFNPFTKDFVDNNGGDHHLHLANMHQVDCENPLGFKVYDPYLIEFIIRNKILAGSTHYMHVMQQMFLPATFPIDYAKTIFSSLENRNIKKHYTKSVGNLLYCDQQLSLLYQYPLDYFYMEYKDLNARFFYISIFDDPDFANKIQNKEFTDNPLKNIIIKYFNNEQITVKDIKELEHIDYKDNKTFFYQIPMIIFCIEKQIASNLSNNSNNIIQK